MTRLPLIPLFTLAAGALSAASSPGSKTPEALPVCASPQQISPAQPLGGGHGDAASMVWNGAEFAVIWIDTGGGAPLKFRRFFADGTPAAPAVQIGISFVGYPPKIVSNGAGYAVVWNQFVSSQLQVMFARLNPDGSVIGAPLRLSFNGITPSSFSVYPSLAWSGNGYGVVWEDGRNSATTFEDIYLTELDAAGNVTRHDVLISNATDTQANPVIAWSSQASRYLMYWSDYRASVNGEIWGAMVTPIGATQAFTAATVTTASGSGLPSMTDTGAGMGLSWQDFRDGNAEIYFARLNEVGAKIGGDLRVTSDAAYSYNQAIVWTGAEFGIFSADFPSVSGTPLRFQRISAAGVLVGSSQLISTSALVTPSAAFGNHGYLVEGLSFSAPYSGLVIPWGCGADSTPPTCAGGYVAYSISGTNATVGWLPSDDQQSDIAYYNVYRNAALIGKSSSTYYNDSGLSLSTSYGYAIQPVNAWQLRNSACTDTIYLTTNSSLTLTMNKSNPAAILNWTDVGASGYRIYRGNDPHVMGQIASSSTQTAQDPNALGDGNSYFYSVDE